MGSEPASVRHRLSFVNCSQDGEGLIGNDLQRRRVKKMSTVRIDELDGAYVDGRVVCVSHISSGERDELEEAKLITNAQDDDEYLYFCDRCGGYLPTKS